MNPFPNKSGIYKIVVLNIGTYYGIAQNLQRRYNSHIKKLNSRKHTNLRLRRLVCELGINSFSFIVIDSGDHLKEAKVRQTIEMHFIKNDIDALNTKGTEHIYATYNKLPLKDKYRDKILYLEYKTGILKVRDKRNGRLIGIETAKDKIRSGYYVSDIYCHITTNAMIRKLK